MTHRGPFQTPSCCDSVILFRFCLGRFPQQMLEREMERGQNILWVVLVALRIRLSWWPSPAGSLPLGFSILQNPVSLPRRLSEIISAGFRCRWDLRMCL